MWSWLGGSNNKNSSEMDQQRHPQPLTASQLRSLRLPAWVDCRHTGTGLIYPAQIDSFVGSERMWHVLLTNISKSECVWDGYVPEKGLIAYEYNSMTSELERNPFSRSQFGKVKLGDIVEVNKFGSQGKWIYAKVIQIAPPSIKVQFISDDSTWWCHYLLTNEIRPYSEPCNSNSYSSSNSTNSNNNVYNKIKAKAKSKISKNSNYNDTNNSNNSKSNERSTVIISNLSYNEQIVEMIKNSKEKDGSLDRILNECVRQFGFESKSQFIANLFEMSKNKFDLSKCGKILAVIGSANTDTDTDTHVHRGNCCNHSHSHTGAHTEEEEQAEADIEMGDSTKEPAGDEADEKHFDSERDRQSGSSKKRNLNNLNNSNNRNNRNNRTYEGESQRYGNRSNSNQLQAQEQVSKQAEAQREQTVSVELLISSTKDVLDVVTDYCDRMVDLKHHESKLVAANRDHRRNKKWKELRQFSENCNIKAVAGLQLFQMQVESFKEKSLKRGLSDKIGTKNSNKLINEFLEEMTKKLLNNKNFSELDVGFILDRIDPFTNAMKSVLDGNKLPEFQELTNVNFDSKTTNNVLSKVLGATSHTIPEKVEKVRQNYKDYEIEQKMNVLNMKDDDNSCKSKKFTEKDANNFYRDINHPMQKARSKKEMEQRAQRDLERDRRIAHAPPDLLEDENVGPSSIPHSDDDENDMYGNDY